MNDEGLADAETANPFRLPRPHPGISVAQEPERLGSDVARSVRMGQSPTLLAQSAIYSRLLRAMMLDQCLGTTRT
jgi:hypothetical protein